MCAFTGTEHKGEWPTGGGNLLEGKPSYSQHETDHVRPTSGTDMPSKKKRGAKGLREAQLVGYCLYF